MLPDIHMVQTIPKIEGHISTIRWGGILIIKENMIEVQDLRLDNRLLKLHNAPCQITGCGFIAQFQDRLSAQNGFLETYLHLNASELSLWQAWLLVGHNAWQSDNRIARYKKYYRSIGETVTNLPDGKIFQEACVSSADGLKFFSAIMLEDEWRAKSIQWLNCHTASALVFVPAGRSYEIIEEIVRRGWNERRDPFPSSDLISDVCRHNIMLFHFMGAFDDIESALVVIRKATTR